MTYALLAWNFVRRHWVVALLVAALVGALALGYRAGLRAGFRQGVASVPPCPAVKEVSHVEVECPKVEAVSPKVLVKYVRDPSLPQVCPPTPVVYLGSARASALGGEAKADSSAEVTPRDASRVSGGPDLGLGAPRVWRVDALVGVGGSGLELGGHLSRQLGPFDVGIYGRVPTHDTGHASGGVSLGFRF